MFYQKKVIRVWKSLIKSVLRLRRPQNESEWKFYEVPNQKIGQQKLVLSVAVERVLCPEYSKLNCSVSVLNVFFSLVVPPYQIKSVTLPLSRHCQHTNSNKCSVLSRYLIHYNNFYIRAYVTLFHKIKSDS